MNVDTKEKPQTDDNVVDMFAFKKAAKPKTKEETDTEEVSLSMAEVSEKNKKNKDRVEKERLQANKGVLRSYRIKS